MPSPPRIAVVDYGAGNLRSVAKALVRSGIDPVVTDAPGELARVDAVVLPGVGAFADGMRALAERGLDRAVTETIRAGKPYLGLCLGLQVLFEESEEHGRNAGLGILEGRVTRFADQDSSGKRRLVPHIGWNTVEFRGDHPMCASLVDEPFYFVHSYYAKPTNPKDVVGVASYGDPFTAAVARDNVFAVQFHPEKSQAAGRRLLDAFRKWVDACRA
jgi:glutamine amidotransferase